ncbi:MAG: hypothetical protein A6D91_09930 [Bacillaceae bacterium G1]|nr:MAG: hypothetical protein A6D91_09930 [Bacillaceae bacterium G1]
MQITLRINGKEKTFTQDFISGRMFRRTLEIAKKFQQFQDGQIDVETLDIAVDYVVDLFDGQFTRDEFYDGIEAGRLIKTIVDCVNEVVNQATSAIGADGTPKKQGA